jgi:uncharacterized protein DUF6077
VFLLFAVEPAATDVGIDHLPGDFFVSRAWQGKVVLAAVLVPLLFSLLEDHAAGRGGLPLPAAAGVAAVGLSTTATFLVPVIALACMAPAARRSPRRAAAGLAAVAAYPVAALVAALLAGGRQPARWEPRHIAPEALVLPALGSGVLAFVAVTAALAGPLLLAPCNARLGTALAALLTALAFAPGVPALLFDLTGLGRPLWRLMWAMPIAALVGVLAVQPAAHGRAAVRLAPALAVGVLVALAGTPVWQGRNTGLAGHPAFKREPGQLAVATELADIAREGDVVLAPAGLSSTLLMLDGRVTAVAPRLLYTKALPATPQARRRARLLLWSFVNAGLAPDVRQDAVTVALRRLGVDVACVKAQATRGRGLLLRSGYRQVLLLRGIWCGSVRDGAALDRAPRKLGALAVLRHVADPEAVEQHVQVALDGVDAQEQRIGDLAVRRRARERVRQQRPAQREQHPQLGLRELRALVLAGGVGRRERRLGLAEEHQPGPPDRDLVPVGEPRAPPHAMSVHERSVAREAVVDQRPVPAGALEDRVHARHLGVPGERDLARGAAADVHQRRLAAQLHDVLAALAVAEQHVRRAGALGLQPLDHLVGGLGTQCRGRALHGATLRTPPRARQIRCRAWRPRR